jgi:hypothetical protein
MSGGTIPFDQIKLAALAQVDPLLREWFPRGKRVGNEFRIGNIRGDAGESLSVNVTTGLWADFSGDTSGHDLIDLRAEMRHGGDRVAAARELAKKLGVTANGHTHRKEQYQRVDEWELLLPPPANAPKPERSAFAGFDQVYDYVDADGRVLFYVRRKDAKGNRRKQFVPLSYGILNGKAGWHSRHPTSPRPLYGLNRLAMMQDATVIVCEGEKAADAAQALLPAYACITWPGGAKAVQHTDLTPLRDRRVIVWPDNDREGHKAATVLQSLLPQASILRMDDLPVGADAADVQSEEPEAWLVERLPSDRQQDSLAADETADSGSRSDGTYPRTERPVEQDAQDWRLGFQRDDRKRVIPNLANAALALRQAPELIGLVSYDEMLRHPLLRRPVPGSRMPKASDARPLQDADVGAVQEWLQRNGLPRVGKDVTQQAIDLVARERAFHPVRNYLDGLRWDGKERIKTWLSCYLGAEQSPYIAKIGRCFLIAMVARIMRPGCKADYMLVLEGEQGTRKSTACGIMAGDWFSDSLPDLHRGDAVRLSMHMRGKWLIEIAEMSSISKAEAGALKAFLTQAEERYTPKYGRNEVIEPRQCLFIGTTNKSTYLRDETGGRRFWPVKTGFIDTDALRHDRDQLFAEAVVAFRAGEKWWPDSEFERDQIAPMQEARFEADAWETPIGEWLTARGRCTVAELARDALHLETSRLGSTNQRRIVAILERLGWETGRSGKARWWQPRSGSHNDG